MTLLLMNNEIQLGDLEFLEAEEDEAIQEEQIIRDVYRGNGKVRKYDPG